MFLTFNGDTGSNYPQVYMNGNGSSANSGTFTSTSIIFGELGTNPSQAIAEISDYSATDKHKSTLSKGASIDSTIRAVAARWANTSAITSLNVSASETYISGDTFHLYGIAKEL